MSELPHKTRPATDDQQNYVPLTIAVAAAMYKVKSQSVGAVGVNPSQPAIRGPASWTSHR